MDDMSVKVGATRVPHAQGCSPNDGGLQASGGEDGACGPLTVCGTYATTLWYADELGARAAAGFAQHQRQDLLGGR